MNKARGEAHNDGMKLEDQLLISKINTKELKAKAKEML